MLEDSNYRFDMGPSWYLMPEFFEHFFYTIGEDIEDHLSLTRLDPSYRIFFADGEQVDICSDLERDAKTFERLETGAGEKLREYIAQSKEVYELSRDHFIYRNYDSFFDFFDKEVMKYGSQIPVVFKKAHQYVSQYFSEEKTQKIMEYIFVFLGTDPRDAPAVYSVLNYVDYEFGVYYPDGGIHEIARAIKRCADERGVEFRFNAPVEKILVEDGKTTGVRLKGGEELSADIVVSNTDRHFTDTKLLGGKHQEFSDSWWEKRSLTPSAYLMYLGVDGELPDLKHHTFYFNDDWSAHFDAIFAGNNELPDDPSFYICNPSKVDDTVAPDGKENVYILVPIAPEMDISDEQARGFEDKIFKLIETKMGAKNFKDRIEFKETFTVDDFSSRYNSFKGSGLGLSHILTQSAYFRPNNVHKNIPNLFYVGADTNPGVGMPMVLASAELAYKRITGIDHAQPMEPINREN